MEENWEIKFTRFVILEMLRKKGYSKVEDHALKIFSDIILDTIKNLMNHTKELSNLYSRNESTTHDLLATLNKYGVTPLKLADFIRNRKKESNNRSLSKEIMNHLIEREHFSCREGLGDLNRQQDHGVFKKIKLRSKFPIKMSKVDKEIPPCLQLEKPPEFYYQNTVNHNNEIMNSTDVKDLKAEEKRIYEIENCKISSIADEGTKEIEEVAQIERVDIKENLNLFDQGSLLLNDADIFEISNNQMF